MQTLANILIDGIAYGMVLFMITVGLALTMGLMRVVNLAHGAFAMLGGYLCTVLAGTMRFELALPLSVLAVALAAVPLEMALYRRIYARSELEQAIVTIGLCFVVIALANVVFGSSLRPLAFPPYLSGAVDLGIRTMPAQRLLALGSGVLVFAGLTWLIEHTDFGIKLRATVDNAAAASALGIDTRRIFALAFALGAGLGALGGIVGADLLPMTPFYPLRYMVIFLAVVAVGGLGSVKGTFAAALLLGLVETAARYLASDYEAIVFYGVMLAVLTLRPAGLFQRRTA